MTSRLWQRPDVTVVAGAVAAWVLLMLFVIGPTMPTLTSPAGAASLAVRSLTTAIDSMPMWALMAAAMMLPAAAVPARHVAHNSLRRRRHRAVATMLAAYLAVWCGFGFAAIAARSAIGPSLANAHLLNVALTPVLLIVAAAWQLSPQRRLARQRCARSIPLPPTGWAATRACASFGTRYGLRCLRSCWPLMLAMITMTDNHLIVTAAYAALIVLESHEPDRRQLFNTVLAALLLVLGVVALRNAPATTNSASTSFYCRL